MQTVEASYTSSCIGGYYLTTSWVAYLGCFHYVPFYKDDSDRYQVKSAATCLLKCGVFVYFTLEFEHCRCLNSKKNLQANDPEECKSGKRDKYFNVYKTIKITKEFRVFDDNNYTYAAAQTKCSILDYYSVKDSLKLSFQNITFGGKAYWTNAFRFLTKQWVDNTTDIEALKDITTHMRNQRCLSASQCVGYPPAVRQSPCNNILPFRCSPAFTPAMTNAALQTGIYVPTTIKDHFQHDENQSVSRNEEWTSMYETGTTDSFSCDDSAVTHNQGSYLEYIVSTSVAFGILIFTIFAIWMCRKVQKTIKSKRHIPSPRIIVSQNNTSANVDDFVEYNEVNLAEMIDITSAKLMEIKEEKLEQETNSNHSSYITQFEEHECSVQVLLSYDTE